jgi:hypothetical protein
MDAYLETVKFKIVFLTAKMLNMQVAYLKIHAFV